MNLQHHFLIAMPSLQDPFFKKSVIYICEHNNKGAMGLVINKTLTNITIEGILNKLNIVPNNSDFSKTILNKPVFTGGPIAEDHGFIVHSNQKIYSSSIRISDNTMITTSRDIIEVIGTKEQPENMLIALGYCAWEKNQLENELLENIWLLIPANDSLLFHTPISERWKKAAKNIGIDDMININNQIGHS
ncbi:YqgE/AlgH family protein [Candidatus Tachikawaea gelatinosa]|uniref:UPF0301 protein TGUWTKB_6150 n=1 Tax=Candidatus Tachikawaea gelatinosa TaxID=1410383 RepID=A0A090AML8_9ENTR|nr:YqgE/AlgH family protein [Candidatus Tachikawaea gelatinosa]BAP58839.1 putative transcriptional regulator [Candidatus Tachikawaea gelatinosa]